MKILAEELLKLKDYRYSIWEYRISHSVLMLKASQEIKPDHDIYIVFANVLYLQMPVTWTGNFIIAPDEDFLEIVNRANIKIFDSQKSLEALKETYALYKAFTTQTNIYILGTLNAVEYDTKPILD